MFFLGLFVLRKFGLFFFFWRKLTRQIWNDIDFTIWAVTRMVTRFQEAAVPFQPLLPPVT